MIIQMHLYGSSNAYVQYSAVVIDMFDLLMEFIVDCFCGSSLHMFSFLLQSSLMALLSL